MTPRNGLERTSALFHRKPGQWISALALMRSGGILSWRTRISELRRWRGMTIENRLRRKGSQMISEYKWVARG